jgi:glycoside/pentoside/hexuronide:cation symporter, GPH family
MAMPLIPAFVLLPAFYAETVGVGLARTGIVLLLVRITDVVSDPLIGWLSDYLRQWAWGRKLQIAVGAIIAGTGLYQLFTPGAEANEIYLFVWYGLMLFGWTMVQIPYLAWTVELSGNYDERVKFNAGREFSGLVGILLLSIVLLMTAEQPLPDQLQLCAIFVLVCGVLSFPFLLILPTRKITQIPIKFFKALSGLKSNGLFIRLILAWLINGLSIGIATACFPLFVKYNLQTPESETSYFLFLYFVAGIAGIPLWIWCSKRLGKNRTWGVAMIIASIAFLSVPLIGPQQFYIFATLCVVTGFCLGADLAIPPAIQSDVVDWDTYLNKFDRSSILFSLWSMATKLSLGLGVAIAYIILGQSDSVVGGVEQTEQINLTLLAVIYGWLPAVLKITAVLLMWNFPLTSGKHFAVQKRIQQRLF